MLDFWSRRFRSIASVRSAAAIIALAIALPGCARHPTGIGCSMCRPPAPAETPRIVTEGKFIATGDMLTPRTGHIATMLDDGRVLIVGGQSPAGQLRSAEIYDPAKRRFEPTGGISSTSRSLVAALLGNGNVFIVGESAAEIYDVRNGRFEPVGRLINEFYPSMEVVLRDSRVLVCDGDTDCEIYLPKAAKFRETSHTHGRSPRNPILLPDGRVLISVAGVNYYNPGVCYELFDPETETFRALQSVRCALWFALRLDDGRIFMGSTFFDPRNNSFIDAGGFPNTGGTATLLQSGKVLVAGGNYCSSPSSQGGGRVGGGGVSSGLIQCSPTAKAWLYDLQTQTQVEIEDMNDRRFGHTATSLKDGTILLAGGTNGSVIGSGAEIYVP
jgi:hypothetical protein